MIVRTTRMQRRLEDGEASEKTDLDAEVRRGLTDDPEGRADVNFLDNVPCIVGCGVQHLVISEAGWVLFLSHVFVILWIIRTIVDDVIDFAIFSANGCL